MGELSRNQKLLILRDKREAHANVVHGQAKLIEEL